MADPRDDKGCCLIPLASGRELRHENGRWYLYGVDPSAYPVRELDQYETEFVDCAMLAEAAHNASAASHVAPKPDTVHCESCIGSGKIREESETPAQDRWRNCMDCTGTGQVPAASVPSTIAPSERALTDDEISAAWNSAGSDRPEAGAADLYLHYMRAVAKAQRAKMLAFMPSATRRMQPEEIAVSRDIVLAMRSYVQAKRDKQDAMGLDRGATDLLLSRIDAALNRADGGKQT